MKAVKQTPREKALILSIHNAANEAIQLGLQSTARNLQNALSDLGWELARKQEKTGK